jgi:hypothetical protein
VRISFARPLILDHSATRTRRHWNRVHQRIAFIDFYQHKFPVHLWWTAFHKTEIDSNGTFARVAVAGANQPAKIARRALTFGFCAELRLNDTCKIITERSAK